MTIALQAATLDAGEAAVAAVDRAMEAIESFFRQEGERLGVEAAFVFGSQLGEAARADSDLDVAVVFVEDTDLETSFERANDIALHLGHLVRHLVGHLASADVDVVVLDQAFSRPMLAYNAVVKGRPVFVREPERHLALWHEAMRQMEDFSSFGSGWQLEVARATLERLGRA